MCNPRGKRSNWLRDSDKKIYVDKECLVESPISSLRTCSTRYHHIAIISGTTDLFRDKNRLSYGSFLINSEGEFSNNDEYCISPWDKSGSIYHILDTDVFIKLLDILTTPKDFLDYLSKREFAIASGMFSAPFCEENFLQAFLISDGGPEKAKRALEEACIFGPSIPACVTANLSTTEVDESYRVQSFFIDNQIRELCIELEQGSLLFDGRKGQTDALTRTDSDLRALASTNRLERTLFAREMERHTKKCRDKLISFFFLEPDYSGIGANSALAAITINNGFLEGFGDLEDQMIAAGKYFSLCGAQLIRSRKGLERVTGFTMLSDEIGCKLTNSVSSCLNTDPICLDDLFIPAWNALMPRLDDFRAWNYQESSLHLFSL